MGARGPQKYRAKHVEVKETQIGRGALRGEVGTDHPGEAKAPSSLKAQEPRATCSQTETLQETLSAPLRPDWSS